MGNSKLAVNKKVFVSDFTLNGVSFPEKFPGVIALDNKDGTFVVHITLGGRVASVVVTEASITTS
jgi:hypothetical protein